MSETVQDYFQRYGPSYRWLATFTVMAAAFTVVLSATIVNVAVPQVMGAFGIGLDKAQWMSTAFIATMTVSQLLSAWVLDRLGTRLTFMTTLTIFAVGALIAANAPNIEILALGRTIQGAAAGVIQPISMVVLTMVFPANRRGFAMGIYSMGIVLAPALGPAVGGLTVDALGWRYMFLLPLPVCLLAFVMGTVFLPTREATQNPRPLDWTGVLLLSTAIFALLYALSSGQREGWLSNLIVVLFAYAAIALWVFVLTQLRSSSPLLDFSVLRNTQFASACVIGFVFGSGIFATTYYVPVFVQTVLEYTPSQAGLLLVPAGLALMVMLPIGGRMADSIPAHYLILVGLLIMSTGFFFMSNADVNTPYVVLVLITLYSRCGMGFIQPPLRTAAVRALPAHQLARGSGTLNFFRQLGGAFGVSGLVIAVEHRTQVYSAAFSATQTSGNETSRQLLDELTRLLGEAGLPEGMQQSEALRFLGDVVYAQSISLAFQDAAMVIALVFLLTMVPATLLSRGKTTA
jgi:EmrB/QacA subfamily drug resistance transporter